MYLYLKFSIEWVLKYMLMCLCFAVLLLTLGRRVTVVVLCVIHSFIHSFCHLELRSLLRHN